MGISIITEKGGNKEPKDQTTTPTNKTSSGLHFFTSPIDRARVRLSTTLFFSKIGVKLVEIDHFLDC